MPLTPHPAWNEEDEQMRRYTLAMGGAAAIAAILALGPGLAAAQSQPPSPATSSDPADDGVDAMQQMHERMVAQMPESVRAASDAMHAQMSQMNGEMGAMMQSMTGAGAPPTRPGG